MKTKANKKALIAAATLATSLVLVACGNDTPNDDTTLSTESSSEMMQSSDKMDTSSMMESSSSAMSSTDSSSESSDMNNTSTKGIATKKFDVSMEQAVDKFKETFPDAKITSVGIDNDSNSYVYQIEGFNDTNEVEVNVDAMTGEIVKQDTDDRDDEIDDDVLDLEGIVTPQEAMKTALEKVGSGYAKEWSLDSKNGKVYYEVDIEGSDKDNDDVHIDAITGDFIGFD